ncbi:hypothetical protein FRC03_008150 [Tulasnella sp. 419]|nr:hypothetical protein FRC02_009296 [Tulasnella sp. 418]KAG8968284.1 hypothetical protein FRC03_008150 [Tulasnella sp. 419]
MEPQDTSELLKMIPVIQDIRGMIAPGDEIKLVKEANALMQESVVKRREEEDKMRAELKNLAQKLTAARQSSLRPANVPSQSQHAQTIGKLDDKRFGLVKSIEEGEGSLSAKEAEYGRLKAELKELEEKDVEDGVELDGEALRLNLYRELGFHWSEDPATGEQKLIIRTENEDVHAVVVDDARTPFALTNLLWELNSS